MSVNTILLDFKADSHFLKNSGIEKLEAKILSTLEAQKHFGTKCLTKILGRTEIGSDTNPGLLAIYKGPKDSTIAIRFFPNAGLVTVNLDYYKREEDEPLLELEECSEIEQTLSKAARTTKSVATLPAIRRGISFDQYFIMTDGRIVEYDIDDVLYDQHSAFQHIQILHSRTFGNMLVLDGDPNMAVSDLVYTESFMRRGVEDYKDKEILILGGGDGGLLNELLRENPKMVELVDIDEMVVQASRKYLREICGDLFDNYVGKNYKVTIGDCVEFMTRCRAKNRQFDYIFADLTCIPICTDETAAVDFIKEIANVSFKILKHDGKLMTHGQATPSRSSETKEIHIGVLDQLDEPVIVDKIEAFIPSFLEYWTFYQIQKN